MSTSIIAHLGLCFAGAAGATYGQWSEILEGKLVASDASINNWFGSSVAVEGDTLVVGAPGANAGGLGAAGAVYVFTRTSLGWAESQRLTSLTPAPSDEFGTSVAIDAGRILVGVPLRDTGGVTDAGAADLFAWNGASWVHSQELVATTPHEDQHFGFAVALDGDTALCGAPFAYGCPCAGEAFVFVKGASAWTVQATLPFSHAMLGDEFGFAVALDADRAVIGAPRAYPGYGVEYSGAAEVFRRTGTTWMPEDIIGPRLPGPTGYNWTQYGRSVALSGDAALGGAPWDVIPWPSDAGSAHLHERESANWRWAAGFTKGTPLPGEEYGEAVALDGNLAAIGAPGGSHGLVLVHARSDETWKQITKLKAFDGAEDDRFGDALALEGERVVAAAPFHDALGHLNAGAVYVYALSAPAPKAYCTAGTSASGCKPTISALGLASATAPSGFTLSAAAVEGQRKGLLIYGTGGKQASPWGSSSSVLCISPPLRRSGALGGTGTLGACDGAYAVDLNALWCPTCPKAASNPGENAAVQAQFWYRDPVNTSNQTTSLSEAIEFTVGS